MLRIAVHKPMPVGPGPLDKGNVHDVSTAAVAFPDIQFEAVHSAWAFFEESASVANFVVRQP